MLIMSREKTKKLLNNLKEITSKKDKFAPKPTPSSTNRVWLPRDTNEPLPSTYDKAKRHKDEDGEETVTYTRQN